jgi:hypothetical protein
MNGATNVRQWSLLQHIVLKSVFCIINIQTDKHAVSHVLDLLCIITQVSLAQKDAQLDQLAQHKAALETRMGVTGGKDAAAVAAAAVAARRGADYVSREQHEEVELELGAVKEQLLECLEELSARERELSEVCVLQCSAWLLAAWIAFYVQS